MTLLVPTGSSILLPLLSTVLTKACSTARAIASLLRGIPVYGRATSVPSASWTLGGEGCVKFWLGIRVYRVVFLNVVFWGKTRSFEGIFGSKNVILGRFWVKT